MKLFPRTHIWLILPLIIVISGFLLTYWFRFLSVPFRQHVHGLTATCWFILVIVQPYLYQKNNIQLHRKIGLIGLFLAGGVIFSALQMLPFNLTSGMPLNIAYGLIFMDFIALGGFTFSVYKAIRNVKNTRVHGRWMIASVLWSLQPALLRLINNPMSEITNGKPPINFTEVIYLSNGLIFLSIGLIILDDYRKEKIIYSSYSIICIAMILMSLLYTYMSEAPWWGNLLQALLKN